MIDLLQISCFNKSYSNAYFKSKVLGVRKYESPFENRSKGYFV